MKREVHIMIMTIAEEEVGETNRQDKIGAGEVDRIRDQGKREREGNFFSSNVC